MKTISSAEFRKTYPRLEETVLVTTNGHPIGTWSPIKVTWEDRVSIDTHLNTPAGAIRQAFEIEARNHGTPKSQAARDAILRKINKGG